MLPRTPNLGALMVPCEGEGEGEVEGEGEGEGGGEITRRILPLSCTPRVGAGGSQEEPHCA
jgi:hypothetical protein